MSSAPPADGNDQCSQENVPVVMGNYFFPTADSKTHHKVAFLATIRGIIHELSPNVSKDAFEEALIEEMPAHKLFNPKLLMETVYYKKLLDYM